MQILFIIAVLVVGGVSYEAQSSVPGGVLYPVKIHVNENVRKIVSVTPDEKTRTAMALASERLEEIEILANRGTLDSTTNAELKRKFVTYSTKVDENIRQIAEAGGYVRAVELNTEFETVLRTHRNALVYASQVRPDLTVFLDDVSVSVSGRMREVVDARADIETALARSPVPGAPAAGGREE